MRRPALTGLPLLSVAVAAVPVAMAMLIMPVTSAHAASSNTSAYAARLLALVNDVRAQHGVLALEPAGGTTAVATAWTQHLAAAGRLSHNPDLAHELAEHGSKKWETYGENVGVGSADDPDGLFVAYMNSPEHRANVLDGTFRYVGVAVAFAGSRAWNTFDFVDVYGATSTPAHHRIHRSASQRAKPPSQTTRAQAGQHSAPATVWVRAAGSTRAMAPASARVAALHRSVRPAQLTHRHTLMAGQLARASTPVLVAAVAPHQSTPIQSTPIQLPQSRRGAVVLALAVLALCVAARRWVLVVAAHR